MRGGTNPTALAGSWNVIETDKLTRKFGDRTAVESLTFRVPRGEIVGFLGPNGAGKSTTLKILSGYLPPTSGRATVGGFDVVEQSLEARRQIGYMPETVPLHPEMRVEEYLSFRAEIKGVRKDRKKAVDRALELTDVKDVSRRLIGELSKGYKQRVGLADALVASPPLLILDEPTEGLDPNQILKFRELIKGLGGEHTIFLSTHILSEVEAVCSRATIIDHGKIVTEGTLSSIRSQMDSSSRAVTLLVRIPEAKLAPWREYASEAAGKSLGSLEGVELMSAEVHDECLARIEVKVAGASGEPLELLVARCVAEGFGVRELVAREQSLERVFHQLTLGANAKEKAPEVKS